MRAGLAAAVTAALLLAGCSGGHRRATATPRPSPVDAYTALQPPDSPGVGSFSKALSDRAYDAAHGLLAQSLADAGTLTGTSAGTSALLEALAVPDPSLSVTRFLTPPTRKGLGVRPLLGPGVTLDTTPVEVVRSSYSADEVVGLGGEHGIRVRWDGAVRYRVQVHGVPHQVAYTLQVAYVFGPLPAEPGGLQLVQVVPGAFHATPVVVSCLAKGLLYPGTGMPSTSDFGPGPFPPQQPGPACPV